MELESKVKLAHSRGAPAEIIRGLYSRKQRAHLTCQAEVELLTADCEITEVVLGWLDVISDAKWVNIQSNAEVPLISILDGLARFRFVKRSLAYTEILPKLADFQGPFELNVSNFRDMFDPYTFWHLPDVLPLDRIVGMLGKGTILPLLSHVCFTNLQKLVIVDANDPYTQESFRAWERYHGKAAVLPNLRYLDVGAYQPDGQRQFTYIESVEGVCKFLANCPKLEKLGIDLEWNQAALEQLFSMPRLHNLDFYLSFDQLMVWNTLPSQRRAPLRNVSIREFREEHLVRLAESDLRHLITIYFIKKLHLVQVKSIYCFVQKLERLSDRRALCKVGIWETFIREAMWTPA